MLLFANNATSALRVGVTPLDVTLQLTVGHGARFPTVSAGDSFFVTLIDASGNLEIVECTARAGDSLTVVRARDGTSAKPFPAGSTADHRPVAEVFRRMSVEAQRGVANGVAPLDANSKLPVANLPAAALTAATGDARYVRNANANAANGYLQLDASAKVPFALLPTELLTQAEGDSLYLKSSLSGATGGWAPLDATGKIPASYIPAAAVDLSGYAKLVNPAFTNDVSVGNTLTAKNLTVTDTVTLSDISTRTVNATGNVIVKGGAPRGRLTFATTAPTGTPSEGDEWVQHEA